MLRSRWLRRAADGSRARRKCVFPVLVRAREPRARGEKAPSPSARTRGGLVRSARGRRYVERVHAGGRFGVGPEGSAARRALLQALPCQRAVAMLPRPLEPRCTTLGRCASRPRASSASADGRWCWWRQRELATRTGVVREVSLAVGGGQLLVILGVPSSRLLLWPSLTLLLAEPRVCTRTALQ